MTEESELKPWQKEKIQFGIETMKQISQVAKDGKISDILAAATIKGILSGGGYRRGQGSGKVQGQFKTILDYLKEVYEKEGPQVLKSVWQIAAHVEGVGFEKYKSNMAVHNEFDYALFGEVKAGTIHREEKDDKFYYRLNPQMMSKSGIKEHTQSDLEQCNKCPLGNECPDNVLPGSEACVQYMRDHGDVKL